MHITSVSETLSSDAQLQDSGADSALLALIQELLASWNEDTRRYLLKHADGEDVQLRLELSLSFDRD